MFSFLVHGRIFKLLLLVPDVFFFFIAAFKHVIDVTMLSKYRGSKTYDVDLVDYNWQGLIKECENCRKV